MAVRLRLRRMGRKKRPFYRIVAVDSREKRDGKYLENIGFYNPVTDPFELDVDSDRALYWLGKGAQPSDTVRSLFRKKGIMLRWDLLKKGKSEEEIEQELKKWEALQAEKQKRLEAARIQQKKRAEKKAAPEEDEVKPEAAEEAGAEEKAEKAESAAKPEAAATEAAAEASSSDNSTAEAEDAPKEGEEVAAAAEEKAEAKTEAEESEAKKE